MFLNLKYIAIFYLISLASWNNYRTQAEFIKICRIYNMYMCDISPNSSGNITEFRFYNSQKSNAVVYVEASFSRDLEADPKLEIEVIKCRNRENPDTCERFTTLKPSNPCKFMFMKGMMWTDFVANIKPPAQCRMKKGHYILTNATVNPDLFSVFPITGYIWKIKLKFLVDKEYVTTCVEAEIKQVLA